MDIENDPKIIAWFELKDAPQSTRRTYGVYINLFCETAKKTPSQIIDEAIKEMKAGKLLHEMSLTSYFPLFMKKLNEIKASPNTKRIAMTAIKSFINSCDIPLSAQVRKTKKAKPMKENMDHLTRDDIKTLLINVKNLRDRAIILVMLSSGMARQEIINLKIKDITEDKDTGIGIVTLRRQKTDVDYVTFISVEAMNALKNYMDERKRLGLESPYAFVTYMGNGSKGEQMFKNTFNQVFQNLGNQLGFEGTETDRITLKGNHAKTFVKSRSHALRKFFSNTLENAGVERHMTEFWMGHAPDTNEGAYHSDKDKDKLKEIYVRHMPLLSFESVPVIRSVTTEDEQRLAQLEDENVMLKARLTEFEEIQKLLAEKLGIETRKTDVKRELESVWTAEDTK